MIKAIQPTSPCADSMRRLWEYLDRELPEAEEDEIRRHLAECGRCRPHAAFAQRLLDRVAAVSPEHGELAELRRRIAVALATRSLRQCRRLRRLRRQTRWRCDYE